MANYLSQSDIDSYGPELVNFAQRAAIHAVAPKITELENQNAQLQQQLAREARRNLDLAVERALPNYRETDKDPRWHSFLREIDTYTGQPRQALLNIAIADGSANRVIAIFKGFMQEAGSTPAASPASGGRTRSFGNKPVYTRAQVKELYAQHRQGAYTGREVDWTRKEMDIIAAGREGRILGGTDFAGK